MKGTASTRQQTPGSDIDTISDAEVARRFAERQLDADVREQIFERARQRMFSALASDEGLTAPQQAQIAQCLELLVAKWLSSLAGAITASVGAFFEPDELRTMLRLQEEHAELYAKLQQFGAQIGEATLPAVLELNHQITQQIEHLLEQFEAIELVDKYQVMTPGTETPTVQC